MPAERLSYVVAADRRTVAGLLRDAAVSAPALAAAGHRFSSDTRLLAPGDQVRLAVRGVPWLPVRFPAVTVVDEVSPSRISTSLVRGPLHALTHLTELVDVPTGARVTDTLTWHAPVGLLGDPLVVRPLLRGVLTARAAGLTSAVAGVAGARIVVATALIDGGRLLAAQRTRPEALAGRWELPGGSVEPGEDEADAVVRECKEELGADVEPCGRLGTDLPIDAGLLRVHLARLRTGSPMPEALGHAAVRWVASSQLDALPWVDADRAVLHDLRAVLSPGLP